MLIHALTGLTGGYFTPLVPRRWLRYSPQVYLPITELVENSPRCLNMHGRTWERVLTITRQPNTIQSRTRSNDEVLADRVADVRLG